MHTLTVLDGVSEYSFSFDATPTVQQVLEKNGIVMPHPCGGRGTCGKCMIEIVGEVSQPDEKEKNLGCRLSCRTRLYGDATVKLSGNTDVAAEGTCRDIPGTDMYKEQEEADAGELTAGAFLQRSTEKNAGAGKAGIGAAVDIGTTTVALAVFDLFTGKCLAIETMLNPQSTVSADVIGRITAAGEGRLEELTKMITGCIETLAEKSGYREKIDKWCVTGNTTMLYLFSGKDPKDLAVAPFHAEYLFGEESTFLGKPLYLPACMEAFVGADVTCAVLDSGMCDRDETALLCDIGTNGEIVLWKNGKLYATSTAAGPVFEGVGISCGCQSVEGAVESVRLVGEPETSTPETAKGSGENERVYKEKNGLQIKTIGGAKPVGLCGSGVIDAVACLLENGTIDETGAMEAEKAVICEEIALTQKDIRQVQLAKAAIAAGIKTLLMLSDTKEEEVTAFYIAGGFGSHLNTDSAIRIGLFPKALRKNVKVLGNGALNGAAALLTQEELKEKINEIASEAVCVNLGGMQEFNDKYIDEMFFNMD